jgi:hypothetical protein
MYLTFWLTLRAVQDIFQRNKMREEMDMDFADWMEMQLVLDGIHSDDDQDDHGDRYPHEDEESYDPMDF